MELELSGLSIDAQVFVGLSNYETESWEFLPAQPGGGVIPLDPDQGRYSSGSATYIAVLAFDGDSFAVDGLSLDVNDVIPPTTWFALHGDDHNQTYEAVRRAGDGSLWVAGKQNTLPPPSQFQDYFFHDLLIAKYNADGTPQFVRQAVFDFQLRVTDMELAPDGGVYVLVTYPTSPRDGGLFRFDVDGALLFARRIEISKGVLDRMGALCTLDLDANGNVYLCGYFADEELLIKLNGQGVFQWARAWPQDNPPELLWIEHRSVVVRGAGIYAQTIDNDNHAVVMLFDEDGAQIAAKQWATSAGTGYSATRLCGDNNGGLVFAGQHGTTFEHPELDVIRFDETLAVQSQQGYHFTPVQPDRLISIDCNADGELGLGYFQSYVGPSFFTGAMYAVLGTDNSLKHCFAGSFGTGTYASLDLGLDGEIYAACNGTCVGWTEQTLQPVTTAITIGDANIVTSSPTFATSDINVTLTDAPDSGDAGEVEALLVRADFATAP